MNRREVATPPSAAFLTSTIPNPFTLWDIDCVPTFLYLTAVLDSTP
jgi:hypothetical protein